MGKHSGLRVGLLLSGAGISWLGGRNYYRNLLECVSKLPNPKIEPVILTTSSGASSFADFPRVEIIESQLLTPKTAASFVRGKIERLASRDILTEAFLKRKGIAVLTHSQKSTAIPTASWIPDFQHRHLPEFFTEEELKRRDQAYLKLCERSERVIVSSETARRDLEEFAPQFAHKARVLQFVANTSVPATNPEELAELQEKYGFGQSYFLLPNQFWAHKNHRIVIDALRLLRQQKREITVLATGSTEDYRNPGFFAELMRHAEESGVLSSFKVLGVIPFRELTVLMRNAVGFINPSRFEGWSTTVEEAKSLGKTILLSDIPVHREQAPPLGIYFPPDHAEVLAEALWAAWQNYNPERDLEGQAEAGRALPQRQLAFAERYQEIALETKQAGE